MSTSLELDSSDVDIELTEDPFMVLNDSASAAEDSDESQSESSDSSFLDISDLDDEIEDEEIDTTESVQVDEHQANQELEYVSSYTISIIPELYYEIPSL
jgi:hypothetical protein